MEVGEREELRWVASLGRPPHNAVPIILATPKISPNYSSNLKNAAIIPSSNTPIFSQDLNKQLKDLWYSAEKYQSLQNANFSEFIGFSQLA